MNQTPDKKGPGQTADPPSERQGEAQAARQAGQPVEPVTFAVAGLGRIGRRHAAIIRGHPGCRLVATCDPRPADRAGEAPGATDSGTPHFTSLENMLAKGPPAEVVCVCTPNGLHAGHSLRALDTGRHVLVEKPMALRRADCARVIERAGAVGRQVFCVMQLRYAPALRWLKQTVDAGRLGRIQLVQLHALWNRDERYYRPGGAPHPWHGSPELDGGVLFTQFAHFVDLLYWVFGAPQAVQSRFGRSPDSPSPLRDTGAVSFQLPGGGLGSFTFTTAAYRQNLDNELIVVGERGSVRIGGQYMDRLLYADLEGAPPPDPATPEIPHRYGGLKGPARQHHFVFDNVVEVLRGQGEATTNAVDGMKTVEIIEEMYRNVL